MSAPTMQSIESQDLPLGSLFASFYLVPSFQREYVWGEEQVERLLTDIYDEFATPGRSETSEYFIGSIVVCANSEGVFELIDGQQRMTTAYLILCAIRDYLGKLPTPDTIKAIESQISASDINERGEEVFRYRVSLHYPDSRQVLDTIAHGGVDIETIKRETRSVENIVNAYTVTMTFFQEKFGNDAAALKRYYAYLTHNVKLIRVRTISLAHALKVFETINDRGIGLDSMDLLKNLMFMEAKAHEYERLSAGWKTLVDTLFSAGEKPLRFLRYYIFARYGVDRLREDEIYRWFVENKAVCGYATKPLEFVQELRVYASAYKNFISGKDAHGQANRYLQNLALLSGSARQHLILLLAGKELSAALFTELCRQVENLYFAYVITRSDTRDFERLFAKWASDVVAVKDQAAFDDLVATHFLPTKEALAAQVQLAMTRLNEHSLQKYRLKYVLAKLTQYVDERAWGSREPFVSLATYISRHVEIEHILPQTPSSEVIAAFDKPDEIPACIRRLGNLTLVEKTINCSVGNGLFPDKQSAYRHSNMLLTKSLWQRVAIGENTAVDRISRELEEFTSWNTTDIERRQTMLTRLAYLTWDIPQLPGSEDSGAQSLELGA